METGPGTSLSPPDVAGADAPPVRRGAAVLCVGALAVVCGLGALSGRAAPGQPTSFELTHGRILSVVGRYEQDVTLARKVRDPEYGYSTFEPVGAARLTMNVRAQRGSRVEIDELSVAPTSYSPYEPGPDYGEDAEKTGRTAQDGNDELAPGKRAVGKLRYRRKRIRRDYGTYVVETVEWKTNAKLRYGTKLGLAGSMTLSDYGGDYGEFLFGPRSKSTGGATAALADGRASVYIRDLRIRTSAGVLHCDVAWTDARHGTVTFTSPEYLAGLTGRIRASGRGTWSITGPKGQPVHIHVRDDGSGTVDLGVGRFKVGEGAFQLSYE